jgi:hypothetical protein
MTETAPAAKPEVKKVEVVKIPLADGVVAVAASFPGLAVKPTTSETYKIITTAEDGDVNFKKGVFFNLNSSATAFNLELQLYSTKGGAHLVQFVPKFDEFDGVEIDGQKIEKQKMGLAARLRIKLPYALGLEGVAALAAKFFALVNPVAEAIRAEVKVEQKAKKEPKKAKAEKAEAPAQGKKVSKAKNKKPVTKATVEVPPLNPEIDAALNEITK